MPSASSYGVYGKWENLERRSHQVFLEGEGEQFVVNKKPTIMPWSCAHSSIVHREKVWSHVVFYFPFHWVGFGMSYLYYAVLCNSFENNVMESPNNKMHTFFKQKTVFSHQLNKVHKSTHSSYLFFILVLQKGQLSKTYLYLSLFFTSLLIVEINLLSIKKKRNKPPIFSLL